jgi:hypothetical protein
MTGDEMKASLRAAARQFLFHEAIFPNRCGDSRLAFSG